MNISAKRSSASQKFLIACLAAFGLMLAVGVGSASAKLEFTLEYNFSGDQTPGTSFGNDGPAAIDVNPDTGEVYVVDSNHNVVPIFDQDGVYLRQIKGLKGEASVATEWSPSSIAIDKSGGANNGYIYVTDIKGDVVQVFDPNGAHAGTLKGLNTPDKSFVNPGGVAVDKDGALYISDTGHQAIVKYVPTGALVDETDFALRFSDPEHAGSPGKLAVDGAGRILVGNAKFSPAGAFLENWGTYGPLDPKADHTRNELIAAEYYLSFAYDATSGVMKGEIPAAATTIAVNETSGRVYAATAGYNDVAVIERRDLADGVTGGATEIKNLRQIGGEHRPRRRRPDHHLRLRIRHRHQLREKRRLRPGHSVQRPGHRGHRYPHPAPPGRHLPLPDRRDQRRRHQLRRRPDLPDQRATRDRGLLDLRNPGGLRDPAR